MLACRLHRPRESLKTSKPRDPLITSALLHMDPTMTSCPFCNIAKHFPPSPSPTQKTDACQHKISPPAYVILSTPICLAFLDILPLSPGHILLTTRQHREKISDLKDEEARELGVWLSKLSRALASVTDVWDWNILQNNGAAATQVINHVHFHIIPRPELTPELRNKSFTMFGRGHRSQLDHREASELVKRLKLEIAKEISGSKLEKL